MGYGRRIPELFYAALNMNQDTTNKEKKTATPKISDSVLDLPRNDLFIFDFGNDKDKEVRGKAPPLVESRTFLPLDPSALTWYLFDLSIYRFIDLSILGVDVRVGWGYH